MIKYISYITTAPALTISDVLGDDDRAVDKLTIQVPTRYQYTL